MRKLMLFLTVCSLSLVSLSANASAWQQTMDDYHASLRAKERMAEQKLIEAAHQKARVNSTLARLATQKNVPAARLEFLLDKGADACAALLPAVRADNAAAVSVLAQYQNSCKWADARQKALLLAMQENKLNAFNALTQQEVSCPEPFDFNPRDLNSRWKPISPRMLSAVTSRCYRTTEDRRIFLKDSLIRLNPGDRSVFWLGDAYEIGIKNPQTTQRWLASIRALVEAGVPVSSDTLLEIVSLSRSPGYGGVSAVPFNATRELVILGLKGGAKGKLVLARLDGAENNWVWKKYTREERKRLSNLLEGKPELAERIVSFSDRMTTAFKRLKNIF